MRSKKPRTIIERIERLSPNSKTFKRFEERLKRQLIEAVIQSGIVDGTLDPRGKTQEQFRIETLDFLRNIAKSKSSIQWTLDFRGASCLKRGVFGGWKNVKRRSCTTRRGLNICLMA